MKRSKAVRGYTAIEMFKDKNGVDQVLLRNRRGHCVQVSLRGGQVVSWKIKPSEELLFRSNAMSTAMRGGIPICFPQYEDGNSLEQQHGFARNRMWIIDHNPPPLHPNDSNDKTYIDLLLKPSANDLRVWPHDFEFRLRVALALDGSLALTSRIRNISGTRFSFFFVQHPYFAVPDISDVRVEGLDTLHYLDNLDDTKRSTEQGALTFESKMDRVYLSSVGEIAVFDHNHKTRKTFLIKKEGLPDAVVWNPWKENRIGGTPHFGPEEYTRMVCVGGAAVENPITLKPNEEWTGKLLLGTLFHIGSMIVGAELEIGERNLSSTD